MFAPETYKGKLDRRQALAVFVLGSLDRAENGPDGAQMLKNEIGRFVGHPFPFASPPHNFARNPR